MSELLDDPIAWGARLIETRDIDPIYDMLWGAFYAGEIKRAQLARWLVAYWCCYHAGPASWLSDLEGDGFWNGLRIAAENIVPFCPNGDVKQKIRWPRSSERRHWRGAKAVKSVEVLRKFYPEPELMVLAPLEGLSDPAPLTTVRARVEAWPMFGFWISFKVADMLERVLGFNVEFPEGACLYASPRKGLNEAIDALGLLSFGTFSSDAFESKNARREKELLSEMTRTYTSLNPPGRPSRICGMQEFETIFCKWHSARSGHYFIGKDLKEVRHALDGWGETASVLQKYLPPEIVA